MAVATSPPDRQALRFAGPDNRLDLAGQVATVGWDGELAGAMNAAGFAVREEAMLDLLLGDLRTASRVSQAAHADSSRGADGQLYVGGKRHGENCSAARSVRDRPAAARRGQCSPTNKGLPWLPVLSGCAPLQDEPVRRRLRGSA